MEHLLDTAPGCYFSFNDEGILLHVNQTICDILGYSKSELEGLRAEMIFTIPTRIFYQTHFFPLIKMQGHAEEIFIFLAAKNGTQVPVLMNAKRRETAEGFSNDCLCIIVTQRKKFEDELVAARKQAEAASKENTELVKAKEELVRHLQQLDEHMVLVKKQNQELKQFNRVVTHDMEEPLRKLFIFTQMLEDSEDAEARLGTIKKLRRVAEQLRLVLSGLQQYLWLNESTLQLQPVDLNRILLEASRKLAADGMEGLFYLEHEELPTITADAHQLSLAFYELLSNAVQFRKPGQKALASVSATVVKKNQFRAMEEKYRYEDYLKLEFRDQGIGFDNRYRDQIFELFRRLHTGQGSGIGLSLCKMAVENHGGFIEAEGNAGEGAVISLYLPLRPQENPLS